MDFARHAENHAARRAARHAQMLDMRHGSLWDKIPQFALPVAATAVLEQLFNASDIAVVGNFAGAQSTAAVAAVGANSSIVAFIINLFMGVALGANVVIANAIGRDDEKAVGRVVHTSVLMAVILGLAVMILGELAAEPVLSMLKVPEDVMPLAVMYLRIYLLGMPVVLLYNFEAAIFRSIGETRTPLIALAVSGLLNVGLNLIFVAIFRMTVNGVAIATVIANAVSSAMLFYVLSRTTLPVRVEPGKLGIDRASLKRIVNIGLPAGVQSAVFSFANVIIQSAINSLGMIAIAGSSAGYNIELIVYFMLIAFGQACTTFVGQNYGAGEHERCIKTLKLCIAEALIVLAVSDVVVFASGRWLLRVFSSDPETIEIGYVRLLIVLSAYPFTILYDTMSGYMRGFGISLVPAVVTMLGICGVRISWILFVFPQHQEFTTIMLAYPISLAVTAVLIFLTFLHYRPSKRYAHHK